MIFEALLGSGASGELRGPYREIVDHLNRMKKFRIAVDIPTGLDADRGFSYSGFKADLTVTLGGLKKGLFFGGGYETAGNVVKGGIGLDESFLYRFKVSEYLVEPEDAYNYLPEKGKGINKYTSGKVLVIVGSVSYPGAAVMTSRAVLKAGAGASVLAFPFTAKELVHKELSEVVVEHYEDGAKGFLTEDCTAALDKRIKWADVTALGPGLGRAGETVSAVR